MNLSEAAKRRYRLGPIDPAKVRALRDAGLPQAAIARAMKCTQPRISQILTGNAQRKKDAARNLLRAASTSNDTAPRRPEIAL
jgi:predicted XRE-type DNA-binding protein